MTIGGAITGTRPIIKGAGSSLVTGSGTADTSTGLGTLILAGNNTYTGKTIVNTGTLKLTGSLATGNIDIAAGASLIGDISDTGVINFNFVNDTPNTINNLGTMDLSGLDLALAFSGTQTQTSYTIPLGSFSNQFHAVSGGSVTYGANSITVAVPEPTTLVLLGVPALLCMRRRRA
jgi:autotransporter-associated beta strand protein